jgi:hypothetical protein
MKDWLECDHCGCEAIESDGDGLFFETDDAHCMTCGWPGDVRVVGEDDGMDWFTNDDHDLEPVPFCSLPDCEDCRGREAVLRTKEARDG